MNVAVLFGGRSPEHDVSLASAAQVFHHLDRDRWRVWPVHLDRDGAWWPRRLPLQPGEAWSAGEHRLSVGPLRPGAALDWLLGTAQVQAVLPVLHGPFGEDGTVQGMCELHDVPCVGSGCAASAVAMDKLRTREALQQAGVPVARAYLPTAPLQRALAEVEFERLRQQIGLPAFVKLDASGSTVGVHRVTTVDELRTFLTSYGGRFRRWFAEQALVGEEITVAVLGNTGDELQALTPVGIYPRVDTWFTHAAKYLPNASEELVPPRGWTASRIAEVQALALRCHEALVCDGMSRTDMIVTADGPFVLETNTLPGMTTTSLLPKAAAYDGIAFSALLDRLLELALQRAAASRRAAPGASSSGAARTNAAATPAPVANRAGA
ncbi:MAG: D-alanine--D-alanine ligase [Planctomycetes bacterium]|nr:D-alanine--D-alanine ligase [Planctomycetota bacterium]